MGKITFNVDPSTIFGRRLSDFFLPAASTDEEVRSYNGPPLRDCHNQIVAIGNLIQQSADDNNAIRDNHDSSILHNDISNRHISNLIDFDRNNGQLEKYQQFFNDDDSDWDLDSPTATNSTYTFDKPDNRALITSKDYAGTKYPFDEFDNTVPILTTGYPANFHHSSERPTKIARLQSNNTATNSSSSSNTLNTVIKPKRPPLIKPQSVPKAAPSVSVTKGRGYYSGPLPKR